MRKTFIVDGITYDQADARREHNITRTLPMFMIKPQPGGNGAFDDPQYWAAKDDLGLERSADEHKRRS